MRGVKCSWKEMQRLHRDVLPALESGDGKKYAELRCVKPQAVTDWRNSSLVMSVLDEAQSEYSEFKNFQPSHAHIIARHFRKKQKPPWGDEIKQQIMDWVDQCEDKELTVEALRMELQAERKADVQSLKSFGIVTSLAELVAKGAKFSTVYADPPWQYSNNSTRSAVGGDKDCAYKSTMTVDEICAEPVSQLAEEQAHLHLWTTNAFLFEAKRVIEAWGFEYKSCFVWVKPQMGIGNYWRVSHEFMLLGVRGGLRFKDRGCKSWLEVDRTKHSRKPGAVRQLIEKVSSGPFLEMYGREVLDPPWTVYGNEVEDPGLLKTG